MRTRRSAVIPHTIRTSTRACCRIDTLLVPVLEQLRRGVPDNILKLNYKTWSIRYLIRVKKPQGETIRDESRGTMDQPSPSGDARSIPGSPQTHRNSF